MLIKKKFSVRPVQKIKHQNVKYSKYELKFMKKKKNSSETVRKI